MPIHVTQHVGRKEILILLLEPGVSLNHRFERGNKRFIWRLEPGTWAW
jgi:hypothetical protein